jgi:hypothetical protein
MKSSSSIISVSVAETRELRCCSGTAVQNYGGTVLFELMLNLLQMFLCFLRQTKVIAFSFRFTDFFACLCLESYTVFGIYSSLYPRREHFPQLSLNPFWRKVLTVFLIYNDIQGSKVLGTGFQLYSSRNFSPSPSPSLCPLFVLYRKLLIYHPS